MAVNVIGVVSVSVFYAIILAVGIWAGWKRKNKNTSLTENVILAGRNIGLFVGILTMTATWVAGGYINGTTEGAFTGGFLRCSPLPIGYALSLLLGGMFFAKPMRDSGYVTMLDPFQKKYGPRVGGLLFLPALFSEIFWSASILSALGSILSVMLDIDNTLAIIISAAVAVVYTVFGGLYSVAYTDVIQLCCVLFGLVFCIPFVWTHPAIKEEAFSEINWIGTVETSSIGSYIDVYLLLILGGIPWQVYFQRVLSCRTSQQAQVLSFIAAFGCLLLGFPPAILGSLARAADWENGTDYGQAITTQEQIKSILPLILQYLTPQWVSFIGLGAVSAAIMSSADSAVLSSSSMFARNIYKAVLFPMASERHVVRVVWISIVVAATLGASMAVTVNSIFGLSYLCADIVYVVLFPQLVLVIYWVKYSNTYGSLAAFLLGFVLRALSGEELLNLPAVIHYPFNDNGQQQFPFRTFIMLLSLITQLLVSFTAKLLFQRHYLPLSWDIFQCFTKKVCDNGVSTLVVDEHKEEMTCLNGNSESKPHSQLVNDKTV